MLHSTKLCRKKGQGGTLAWAAPSLHVQTSDLLYWDGVKSEMYYKVKPKVRQNLEECTTKATACVKNNIDPIKLEFSLA